MPREVGRRKKKGETGAPNDGVLKKEKNHGVGAAKREKKKKGEGTLPSVSAAPRKRKKKKRGKWPDLHQGVYCFKIRGGERKKKKLPMLVGPW